MSNNGEFAKFIAEFGSKEEESSPKEKGAEDEIDVTDGATTKARQNATAGAGRKPLLNLYTVNFTKDTL